MMDAARIAQLTSRAFALSALRVGTPSHLYRPTGAGNPIMPANLLATLPVAASTDNLKFRRPDAYATPLHQLLVDTSQTQVGDYLVGSKTFFIVDQGPMTPVNAVLCNAVLSVHRPTASDSVGAVAAYGGDEAATEAVIMDSFPASLLQGTKGEKGDVNLPGDTRSPWWSVLMPALPGIRILTDDVLVDASGTRYVVSSPELTAMGWRMTAMEASA